MVHCAAVGLSKDLLQVTDEEWRSVMQVNLDGSFWLGRAVGRVMAQQRHGTMVFFASDRGHLGASQAVAYAASKGGVIALVKSLALALARFGVTVNAVNPGPTDTPMLTEHVKRKRMEQDPLGRLSTTDDIAEVVAFLCGPAREFMTGQVLTTRMR
jgi:NAD(P)-dependent dehydrogenase (short-subunit alcohol dehydrogenase family)